MKLKNTVVFIVFGIFFMSVTACIDEMNVVINNGHPNGSHHKKECKSRPVVSPDWLEHKMTDENLIVVDVRPQVEYDSIHIEGSINIPMVVPVCSWCVSGDLMLELPAVADLESMLGAAGISNESKVVIVTSVAEAPNPPYPLANATRVAITLFYVGLDNVSILDGGINNWVASGKEVVSEPTVLPATEFVADVKEDMFVDVDYVEAHIGSTIILDARDAAVYAGEVVEPWADKPGHIPSALSLPTPSVWNEDGTYKSKEELKVMVRNVIGCVPKDEEIIVYCGVGGYLSTLHYVLTAILGYENVKAYDGSAQGWVLEHDMEL